MRIAVLMSAYNGEKYIREQINSILEQEGEFELDLWVRDDGSSDQTKQILHEYANQQKIHWYTGENMRPARSFLHLVQHCPEYDFYAFADQDDYWMPDKIKAGLLALEKEAGPALYCANAELVDSKLQSLGRNVYRSLPRTDFETLTCAGGILGCTMIFNQALRNLVCEGGIPSEIVLHDFYFAVVCAAVDGRIVYDPNAHMKYRQHENNVVGVPESRWETVKARIRDIGYQEPVGVAKQAQTILRQFAELMGTEQKEWLAVVAGYKTSLWTRMKLAASRKTRYVSKNMGIKLRLSILLGNR